MRPIRRLPSALGSRRSNTLEQEREYSEKIQEVSYRKAINDEEAPVKMKHVRKLIIATHQDKDALLYWKLAHTLNPLSTDVTAWKFCHTLHMLLRDGHKHTMRDTIKNFDFIKNIREHFNHLKHGYGRLIVCYSELLLVKLRFHRRNPQFPSNLSVKPDDLHSIADADANNYFELAVEMFEYTECILNLYNAVFSSLDQSRANSNTRMGQCRLAPLIPCIQDSVSIYDLTVRIMFNLHKALTVDLLSGHRDRFNQQFPLLHAFYANTANLQYFKLLNITIPQLPKDPPNFLIEAELQSHVAPVVVLQPELDEDLLDGFSDTASSAGGAMGVTTDMLLALGDSDPQPPPVPPHPHPDIVDGHNGSLSDVMSERESSVVESLARQLEEERSQLQLTRSQFSHQQQQLAVTINQLQANVAQLESEMLSERAAKESIMVQVEAAAAGAEAVTRLSQEENNRRLAEEKFSKMKEVYQKLRDEHVSLIRAKAEVDRCCEAGRHSREAAEAAQRRLESRMAELEAVVAATRGSANQEKNSLLIQVAELQERLDAARAEADKQALSAREESKLQVLGCVSASTLCCSEVLQHAMLRAQSQQHAEINSTPEFTLLYENDIMNSVSKLRTLCSQYSNSSSSSVTAALISELQLYSHNTASFLLYATAASHVSPDVDKAHELLSVLESLNSSSNTMLAAVRQNQDVDQHIDTIADHVTSACSLVSGCVDSSSLTDDVAEAVEREMEAMQRAIEEATRTTSNMLETARSQDTGLKLEVNESLLGICMELLSAVQVLVLRAAELQKEVVQKGRGGASPKDFYKRNHRWTQGLISGAKSVAIACQALMTAADAVVCKGGRFEEVIVSSREIAASSMQLVMASRVKADPGSAALSNVNAAAKVISGLTGNLVATAENCRDKVTTVELDFSSLSLHQSKRLEMDTMVKVLEAEQLLVRQREKFAELRRHHYQLAADKEDGKQQQP